MRALPALLLASPLLLLASTAHAYAGGYGLLTVDGLPPDIVLTEGVPQDITFELRVRLRSSPTLCHGETSAQITIPNVIEAIQPCYGNDANTITAPGIPDIDGGYCNNSVGDNGLRYAFAGGGFPSDGDQEVTVQLHYDGSPVTQDHGQFKLWSDGKCSDVSADIWREAGAVNIHILPPSQSHEDGFIAISESPTGVYFFLDHPELNGNPSARLIVTPYAWDETPTSTNHGVFYSPAAARWGIFRENLTPMPTNLDFVVAIGGERSFLHTATSANTSGSVTYLDDDRLNANPYAAPFVTHNYNPPGAGGILNDHAVGVYYSPWTRQWMIYTEDSAALPLGTSFNVVVASDWTGGPLEEMGQWPDSPPAFNSVTPAVLQHVWDYPESTYEPSPISFLVDTLWCWDYFCFREYGPADPSGIYDDGTRFYAWVPFPLVPY